MRSREAASRSAVGGSSNERATELRARVGAVLAAAVIRDEALTVAGLEIGAPDRARLLRAEGDEPVDDLIVVLEGGARAFVQVKLGIGLTKDPRGPFMKALSQFIRAIRGGLEPGDHLILASANVSGPLNDLGTVLDRERLTDPGGRTRREQKAIDLFWEAASRQGITDVEFAEIRKRLIIWQTDPTTGDAAAALISRLDGAVTAAGTGTAGMRALADVIRELARRRGGLDGVGLVRALAARDVPLAEGGPATGTVAMAHALERHEAVEAQIGSTLRLIGVRGDLGELPFERADAGIEVEVADEERPSGRKLEHAFRRRGRVVLEGSPGGGKSTALRTLGALAATRDDWPVAIRVHLQQLAKASTSLTRAVVATASDHLPSPEAVALGASLERELARGNILLLLDGLDEVRRGRSALIERLVEWFGGLHPGVEVIIATRPSAASDAAGLGFPVLRLKPPDRPRVLVDAILDATRPESAMDPWTDARRRWLDAAFDRDPRLTATPLTIVILTLIAARSRDPSALPTVRAQLLKRALEDVVGEWELEYRQRGAATVGPLDGSRAEEALMISFRVLGCAAIFSEPPTRGDAKTQIAERLRPELTLKPGDARAAARDAIGFWDEAGLISFDADTLRLTLRPLGELAAAWDASLRTLSERRAWVVQTRRAKDLWETLALAAALEPDLAQEWAAGIKREGDEAELAAFAAALRDGVRLDQRVIDAVATRAGERLLARSESIEQTAQTLLKMPLSEEVKAHLRPHLSAKARRGRAVLIEALATARWSEEGPEAEERLRACISEGSKERTAPPPEPNVFVIPERDSLYYEAYEAAAIQLAGGSRADAELITNAFDDGGWDFIRELSRTLREAGHYDLADAISERLNVGAAFAAWKDEDFEGAGRRIMGWAAALAEPANLQQLQRRRLDELANLFEAASLNWMFPSWIEKRAALAQGWIKLAALLGGFDLGVIAAQARIVLDDMDAERGTETLAYDNGTAPKLDRWDRLDDPAAALRHLVAMLGISPHQVMHQVGRAIAYAPAGLGPVALLEKRVEVLLHWSRWYVTRLIILIAPDPDPRAEALAADADPILRSIGAWYLAYRYLNTSGTTGGDVFAFADDPDENVREAIVDGFAILAEKLDEPVKELLRAMRSAPRQPWICRYCGASNPPQPRSGCVSCSTSGPDVVGAVHNILNDRQRRPYRGVSRRGRVRRH